MTIRYGWFTGSLGLEVAWVIDVSDPALGVPGAVGNIGAHLALGLAF